jgi:hypothetical protein
MSSHIPTIGDLRSRLLRGDHSVITGREEYIDVLCDRLGGKPRQRFVRAIAPSFKEPVIALQIPA